MTITSKDKLKISQMIFRMGRLVLEPGDLVVLQTSMFLDKDQVRAIKRSADQQFKPFKVVILTAGLKVGVLRKQKEKKERRT
jgi:hypothetical protein